MINAIGQLFAGATVGGVSTTLDVSGSPGWVGPKGLNSYIRNELKKALSKYHYIEENTGDK